MSMNRTPKPKARRFDPTRTADARAATLRRNALRREKSARAFLFFAFSDELA